MDVSEGELLFDRCDGESGNVVFFILLMGLLGLASLVCLQYDNVQIEQFGVLLAFSTIIMMPMGPIVLAAAKDSFRIHRNGIILPTSNLRRLFKGPRFIPFTQLENVKVRYYQDKKYQRQVNYFIDLYYQRQPGKKIETDSLSYTKEAMFQEVLAWLRYAYKLNGRKLFRDAPDIPERDWEEARAYFDIRNKGRPFPRWWQMMAFRMMVGINFLIYFTKMILHLHPISDNEWITWPLAFSLSVASFLIGTTVHRLETRTYERKVEMVNQMLKMREYLAER